MPEYNVSWTIDSVTADSPEEAAQWCRDTLLDPANIASFFHVTDEDGTDFEIDTLVPTADKPDSVKLAWRVTGTARQMGALGNFEPFSIEIDGEDADEVDENARQYMADNGYEHVSIRTVSPTSGTGPLPDSVKLVRDRLARDLTEAVNQRATGAHPSTYLLGRLSEPGISWDDDFNLRAWDYDPTDPQKYIVVTEASLATATCKHCGRSIAREGGRWVDPEATGDDAVWRETCDAHDTFTAEHEPDDDGYSDMANRALTAGLTDAERGAADTLAKQLDNHGNRVRQEGVDRCPCGSKYWENDRCTDCGGTEIEETT